MRGRRGKGGGEEGGRAEGEGGRQGGGARRGWSEATAGLDLASQEAEGTLATPKPLRQPQGTETPSEPKLLRRTTSASGIAATKVEIA